MSSATQNKPFAASSPDDHRAPVWVATFLCLAFVLLGVGTRVWVRFKMFGIDDYLVLVAFAVGLAQFCTIFGGLSIGLGKSTSELSSETTAIAGQVFLASEALFVITLYIIKHSVLCTFQRLLAVQMKKELLACRIFHGLLAACAIASLLLVTVECQASSLLTRHRRESCSAQTPRWVAITAIDGVTEMALFVAFCAFISTLQMQRIMKLTVVGLFAFRLGCIAFSSVHAKYIAGYVSESSSTNGGLAVVGPLVWQQLATGYSLLSAILMALKSFLQSFDVGSGWGENATYKQSSAHASSNGRNTPGMYGLQAFSKRSQRSGGSRNDDWDRGGAGRRQEDLQTYQANVHAAKEDRDDRSTGSGISQISQRAIIKYEKRYEVTTEAM